MSEVTGSVGQVLADRYRLSALLGRGGMGCVWRAEHLSLGTPVAIKLVHSEVARRPGMLSRFLREAQAAARLRSVNVVQILDHGVHDGVPYIAMECLEGESLAQRLDRERQLGPAATGLIMIGVCRALARAHRMGIVHRDLKPDNIFLARDEAGTVVKVLDFGIAKMIEPQTIATDAGTETLQRTETGAMLGTPRYMSPEQARGRATLDGRSDLWSLAVIAFECLTGRVPFDAGVMGELMMQICSEPVPCPSSVTQVPRGFDAWFERATQRDPAARFQTVRDFADALADALTPGQRWLEALSEGDPVGVPEPAEASSNQTGASLVQTGSPPRPRSRRPFALGVAAAVTVAIVAIGVTTSRPPKAQGEAAATASPSSATGAIVAPPTPPAATAAPSVTVAAGAEVRRVRLVVLPEDASVEVDGRPSRARDGVVEIAGTLGSVHRVRLSKGKQDVEGDVSVTEAGAMPPKLALPAATGAAAVGRPARPLPPPAPATAAPRPIEDRPKPLEKFE